MGTRSYWITDPDTGRKVRVPSTTGITKVAGDKGGLFNWYFEGGKEAAALEAEGLGPFRTIWDLPRGAAEIGTIVHAMIECDLRGNELDRALYQPWPAEADEAFDVWLEFKDTSHVETVAVEHPLTSVRYRYGGTLDLVARINGRLTLADFKTGKGVYSEHLYQIAAYAHLWAENHSEPLERMGILRLSKTDGGLHQHFWPCTSPTMKRAWEGFRHARALYDIERVMKDAA